MKKVTSSIFWYFTYWCCSGVSSL